MVDEIVTRQELIDAQKDAQSLDDFINGDDEQIVVTRLLKEYPTLANAIRQIYEKGGKFYPTLAAANADIANIRTDVYVITGDNGAYYKATAGATTLTKSAYDPLTQAKNYADGNPLFRPVKITNTDLNTILKPGIYTVTELSSATLALNFPKNELGFLLVAKGNLSSIVFQVYYAHNTIFTRVYNGTSWATWSDNGYTETVKNSADILENRNYVDGNPLFKPITITGIDLNTILESGIYTVPSPESASLALNFPKNQSGFLLVAKGRYSSIVFQVYYAYNAIFTRSYNSVVWSEWSDNGYAETIKNSRDILENRNIIETAFDMSSNIFSGAIPNTTTDPQGNIVADSHRWLSDFISCASGEVFSVSHGSYRISYYDENKVFISQISTAGITSFTVDRVRAKYFRLSSVTPLDAMQLNKGATLLPYEPFKLQPKYLPELIVSPEQTTFFHFSSNLFDAERVESNKTMNAAGNVVSDELRWLSDFIEVESGKTYSVPTYGYRIIEFDKDKAFISMTATADISSFQITKSRTKFIKLSSVMTILSLMHMNEGSELLPYEPFGVVKIKDEFLPDREVDVEDLKQQLIAELKQQLSAELTDELTQTLLPKYEPSFPSLNFNESMNVSESPMWMSSDGNILYGKGGIGRRSLMQSTDDWATRVQIGPAFAHAIMAVRTLDDGELLVSTTRIKDPDVYSKVWKSVGYDKNNPSSTTFKEVLVSTNIDAFFANDWGMSAYQNIVTVSEYGMWGATGAKHVYLSTDYGNTFSLIFDLYATQVDGRPALTERAHMHTAAYDPYFNRIWIVVGDNPNTATYYSDDLGATWTHVDNSDVVQYTGIIALPEAVLFGSDRHPNGVYVYHRKDKYEMPKIEPLLKVNDLPTITHVFGLPFKKDWSPTSPVYFSAGGINNSTDYAPCIVATVDGKKAFKMWEGNKGDGLSCAIGPTASGKIIAALEVSPGNFIVKTANAPTWSR